MIDFRSSDTRFSKFFPKPELNFIGTMAALIAGGLSAAGAIGGSAVASHAAGKAADAQVSAADYAANLQHQDAQAAQAFQEKQYNTEQQQIQPWLKAGTGAITQLSDLLAPGGDLTKQFQAPTSVTEQNDPGFQFRLQQGQQALERSAAARGGLLSGGTAKALDAYSQNEASNEYGNVYNRAFNEFQTNQSNEYNRLAGLSGIGQQAQASGAQQGQAAANNISDILLTSGQQQGQDAQNAAAARASGYVAGGNAWAGGLSGGLSSIGDLLAFSKYFNPSRNTSTSSSGGGISFFP